MNRKAFVLLSGGIDSTTCLAKAMEDFDGSVEAISIDYGQRHSKEIEQAKKICEHYGVQHTILNLRNIMSGEQVMLTDKSVEIPSISYDDIKGVSPTYVPFRNGTLLSAITAHAQKYVMSEIDRAVADRSYQFEDKLFSEQDAKQHYLAEAKDLVGIYFGAHAEDAHNWAYPDCTPEFIGAMANAIYIGTYFTIRLFTPFAWAKKHEIITAGDLISYGRRTPYEMTWSCYAGEELHCGTCPTCRARKDAFLEAGVEDPTEYAA